MARRVEEVDEVRLAAGVREHQRDGRGGDADAALLLRDGGVCVANVLAEVPRLRARGLDQHVEKERLAWDEREERAVPWWMFPSTATFRESAGLSISPARNSDEYYF